ncbi:MAG TPA: dihydroorotate dehydrogenase-like protein [Candidatus Omnitrophota bacterium]|nr:dihydroorotate dehydrogenase-like protein [Candidatus Omnitrophota bacterium]
MDLKTQYLGLELKNPLVVSASPLTKELDNFKKLEDAGVAAIVCHSIFEEQLTHEKAELDHHLAQGTESFAEALSYFPVADDFKLGPVEYLNQIRKAKANLDIPVIGSLNGHTMGGWTDYAKQIELAGADALELNVYFLATQLETTPEAVEANYKEIVKAVKSTVKIPVAVKLSPYFSAMSNFVKRLDDAGTDGFVMFNRFYQPDLDIDSLDVVPSIQLSTSAELRLPLRWIAILYGKIKASLAANSGIHTGHDMVKAVMAGADVAMSCATFLVHGPQHAKVMLTEMGSWMEKNKYESVAKMKGVLSQKTCPHPESFERANYMRALNEFEY